MFVTVGLPIVGVVIGALITVLVTFYFFNRSLRHRLAIYCTQQSSLLSGIDPDIRKELNINFRAKEVRNLSVLHLLVANEGVSSIRDVIKPLIFHLPEEASLVDASIIYVAPEGRQVHVAATADQFAVEFPVLNASEYFMMKVLVSGRVRYEDLQCTITAENLPPKISVENGYGIAVSKKGKDYGGVILSLIVLSLGLSVAWNLYLLTTLAVPVNPINVIAFAASGLLGLLFLLIGMVATSGTTFSLVRPSKHFIIPKQTTGLNLLGPSPHLGVRLEMERPDNLEDNN